MIVPCSESLQGPIQGYLRIFVILQCLAAMEAPPQKKRKKKKKEQEVIKMFMIGGFVSFAYRNIVEGDIFPLITRHTELENRLLARFDAASQKRELSTMAECANFLSQVILLSCDWTGYFFA